MDVEPIIVDRDINQRLEAAATHLGITRDEFVKQAIESFVKKVELQNEIDIARDQIARGECYSNDEVVAMFAAKCAGLRNSHKN